MKCDRHSDMSRVQVFSGTERRERTLAYRSSSKECKLCGAQLPAAISSSGHEMTVVLVSDASVASRGFQAQWSSEEDAGRQYTKKVFFSSLDMMIYRHVMLFENKSRL